MLRVTVYYPVWRRFRLAQARIESHRRNLLRPLITEHHVPRESAE